MVQFQVRDYGLRRGSIIAMFKLHSEQVKNAEKLEIDHRKEDEITGCNQAGVDFCVPSGWFINGHWACSYHYEFKARKPE